MHVGRRPTEREARTVLHSENMKAGEHLEGLRVFGMIILKCILKAYDVRM
jgi:hypothetical protein